MIELGLLELLAILEILFVLLVVIAIMTVRGMGLRRRLKDFMASEGREPEAPEPISYAAYLRDESLKNRGLMDRHGEEGEVPEWLRARQRFLELEVEAQEDAGNPVVFQQKLNEGFQSLLEEFRPEPEVVTETVVAEPESEPEPEPETPAEKPGTVPEEELHEKEVKRLRDLIGHQQDAMKTLRSELESREGEIADLESIVAQLDAFEAQTSELVRCIEVLEQENERLKHARESGDTEGAGTSPEELGRLKEMVNEQQSTIGNLQGMIEQLRPEAGKAHELEDMVNDVLKSNQELNTCILVLEEENQSLRNQLDGLQQDAAPAAEEAVADGADVAPFQQRIQELESLLEFKDATLEQLEKDLEKLRQGGADAGEGTERVAELEAQVAELEDKLANTEVGAGDEELEIKVQELEALLEFKEATIEEMEKQYAELEAKYLELAGGEMP